MLLYDLVKQFNSKVILRNNSQIEADTDSVIAMLMLDSEQGSKIDIEVSSTMKIRLYPQLLTCSKAGLMKFEKQ